MSFFFEGHCPIYNTGLKKIDSLECAEPNCPSEVYRSDAVYKCNKVWYNSSTNNSFSKMFLHKTHLYCSKHKVQKRILNLKKVTLETYKTSILILCHLSIIVMNFICMVV